MPLTHRRAALALVSASVLASLSMGPVTAAPGADDLAPLYGAAASSAGSAQGYIVVLQEGRGPSANASAKAAAVAHGARIGHTYSSALRGFSAQLDADGLRAVRANPDVAYVERDQVISIDATQSPTPSWGLDRTDQNDLPLSNSYTYANTGSGVTAYIIDTGIRATHTDLSGRVSGGYTAISDGRGTTDCNGHGTHVAGTVGGEAYGIAKDVALVPVRVLGCTGSGSTSGVIAGVDWVTANSPGPAVANMSLGGGASTALDSAVQRSISSGVSYALAAGNDYRANACNSSPARVAAGVTVGSTTRTDTMSDFSNAGSCVDILAPGSSITSAWYTSNTATNTISGTSMATPHVAGAIATYLQGAPAATPAQAASWLQANAIQNTITGVPSGTANRLLHVPAGGSDPDPDPTSCADYETVVTASLTNGQQRNTASFAAAGTISACLDGPSGVDFDLYLQRRNSSGTWSTVASSTSAGPDESLTYSASSGTYRIQVRSYSGAGTYTLGYDRP